VGLADKNDVAGVRAEEKEPVERQNFHLHEVAAHNVRAQLAHHRAALPVPGQGVHAHLLVRRARDDLITQGDHAAQTDKFSQ
jgi:hypothetical protein